MEHPKSVKARSDRLEREIDSISLKLRWYVNKNRTLLQAIAFGERSRIIYPDDPLFSQIDDKIKENDHILLIDRSCEENPHKLLVVSGDQIEAKTEECTFEGEFISKYYQGTAFVFDLQKNTKRLIEQINIYQPDVIIDD